MPCEGLNALRPDEVSAGHLLGDRVGLNDLQSLATFDVKNGLIQRSFADPLSPQ